MEEFATTPYLMIYAALLEFRRCGMDKVRLDLLFNCLHEGTVKILADPMLAKFWKSEWFYRSEQGDEEDIYWMPAIGENLYFQFKVRKRDYPHLGKTGEEAISFTRIQLITMQQDKVMVHPKMSLADFDHPFYKALCSGIQAGVVEEGKLEQAYRRDMIKAEKEVRAKYRQK